MSKFVSWSARLAAIVLIGWGIFIGIALFAGYIIGSNGPHGTIRYVFASGASVLDTGPAKCVSGYVNVPVEVVASPGALIDGKYTKVVGTLTASQAYVYVDAKHGVTTWGWNRDLAPHPRSDALRVQFTWEQDKALREHFHVSECCMPPDPITRPMDKCHLGRVFGGS